MASEIRSANNTGLVLYAHVVNTAGKRWNGAAFETYTASNYANYRVAMTEQGSSGTYFADFPALILAAGFYEYFVYLQSGASSAEGDQVIGTGDVNWDGTAAAGPAIAGAMSGIDFLAYIKRLFMRTDKDTELYDSITDAVSELRRVFSYDEDEVEMTTTDTISVLGDFKLNLESDLGLLIGDIVAVYGDDSHTVRKISKGLYDQLYPNPSSATATRGLPQHFCIYAGQIYFGPVPDLAAYTYRMNYSKGEVTISSATGSVPFTKHYREALRFGVLSKIYDGLDDDLMTKYMQKWEFFKAQAQVREELNQKGTGFVEYSGV